MSNKLKNDSYFVFKKKIYNIKFFFIKRNKIIADFKDLDSVDEDKLVEEANLLYVAITRAKYEVSFLSDDDE